MDEVTVPKQFWDPSFRFYLVKPFSKKPAEPRFNAEANYSWSDPKLREWLKKGGNVGILCGPEFGNLLCIDVDVFDENFVEKIVETCPATYCEKGKKGLHIFYRYSGNLLKNSMILELRSEIDPENSRPAVEFLWKKRYVVISPSIHPDTKEPYVPLNDLPIAEIGDGDLLGIIQFILKFVKKEEKPLDTLRATQHYYKRVVRYLGERGLIAKEHENYVAIHCPFHPPDNNPSFVIYKNTYLAVDFHDGQIYTMVKLTERLGLKRKPMEVVGALLEEEMSFLRIAESLWGKQPYFYDKSRQFWLWNHEKHCYEPADETDMISVLVEFLEQKDIPKRGVKERLIDALRVTGRKRIPKEPPKEWIQFGSRIINIETLEVFEPSPEYFFTNPVPWEVGDSEECPTIDKLFGDWVGKENKQVLYELVAYCLYRDYPIQRLFALVGSGRNGKSEFLRLLTRFLGPENVVAIDLEKISRESRFETAKLYRKLVGLGGETNYTVLQNTQLLKRLCGGDLIGGEKKFKDPFSFTNYAKIIFSTNQLPMTTDKTEAFYRRWLIIQFPNKFEDGKNVVDKIPPEEFEALARMCIKVLKELLERGKFYGEGNIEEKQRIYEALSNPLTLFLEENYEKDPNGEVQLFELAQEFEVWCRQRGYRVHSKKELKKLLEAEGFIVDVKTIYIDDRKTRRAIVYGLKKRDFGTQGTRGTCDSTKTPYIGNLIEKHVPYVPHVPNNTVNLPSSEDKGEPQPFWTPEELRKHFVRGLSLSLKPVDEHTGRCGLCLEEHVQIAYIDEYGHPVCKKCAEVVNRA